VAYMWDGENLVVSGANAGLDRPPSWWLNLQADPRAEVEVEGRRIAVRASEAEGEERARLWRRYVDRTPAVERTAALTEREIPLVVLEPVD
jgi:deazaflavin-dependent oxidoreductase (nitroreductase family)